MKSPYSDSGIILRIVDSGEADKFVTMLTLDHGLASFTARGVRRATSRKSSHLDPLNHVRFSVGRGDQYQYLNQVESLSYYSGIKSQLDKTRTCLTFAEILFNTLPLEVVDVEMFLSLKSFMDGLNKSTTRENNINLSKRFALYLLRHLGYPPPKTDVDHDILGYFESIMNRKIISKDIK